MDIFHTAGAAGVGAIAMKIGSHGLKVEWR